MTNKEAKEKLYMEWQKFLENNIDYAGISEAYKTAFKALEQEPILDKIRAIVDDWKTDTWTDNISYECMVKIAELVEPQESEEVYAESNN